MFWNFSIQIHPLTRKNLWRRSWDQRHKFFILLWVMSQMLTPNHSDAEGLILAWSAGLRGANRRRRTRWRRHTLKGCQPGLRSALAHHYRTNLAPNSLAGITPRRRAWHTWRQWWRSSASWRWRRTIRHWRKLAWIRRGHVSINQYRKNRQTCHNQHDKLVELERQT